MWGAPQTKGPVQGKKWLRSFVDEMLIWSCSNELLRNPVKSQRRLGNPYGLVDYAAALRAVMYSARMRSCEARRS